MNERKCASSYCEYLPAHSHLRYTYVIRLLDSSLVLGLETKKLIVATWWSIVKLESSLMKLDAKSPISVRTAQIQWYITPRSIATKEEVAV